MLNSGAAGFVLSRKSLEQLMVAWGKQPGQNLDGLQAGGDGSVSRERGKDNDANAVIDDAAVQSKRKCVANSQFEKNNPGTCLRR